MEVRLPSARSTESRLSRRAAWLFITAFIIVLSAACSDGDADTPEPREATSTTQPAPTQTAATETPAAPAPTVAPTQAPTRAPAPTTAPRPTSTPQPTATPVPAPEVRYFANQDGIDYLVMAGGNLFVGGSSSGFISKRDPVTLESIGSLRGGRDGLQGMTFDGDSLWTSDFTGSQVRKLGLDGEDRGRFDVRSPRGITHDGSHVWIANKDDGTVTRLALDGTTVGVYEAGNFPEKLAFAADSIWVTNTKDESVTRLSLEGEIMQTVDLGIGRGPSDIDANDRYVWVTNGFAFLTRIDPVTMEKRDFDVGRISGDLFVDGDSVWVAGRWGETHGSVTRIDSEGRAVERVEVGGNEPAGIAVHEGTLFVGVDTGRQVAVVPPQIIDASAIGPPAGIVESEIRVETSGESYAGTLTLPDSPGPHPAALLISGSGENDRDILFTWPWGRSLADHLGSQGIAVLRVDKRGIGGSTGSTLDTPLVARIADSIELLDALKEHDGIDPARVGVIGFSEGGLVASGVGAEADTAFVMSLGGPVAPGDKMIQLQTERLLQASGSAESYVVNAVADITDAHNRILTGEGRAELEDLIELGSVIVLAPDYVLPDAELLLTPWYESFLRFDSATYWPRVEEPALVLFGGVDWVVPSEQSVPRLRALFEEAGKANYSIEIVPGANHFFQPSVSGAIEEFSTNPREFVPGFLETLSSWIKEQTGNS